MAVDINIAPAPYPYDEVDMCGFDCTSCREIKPEYSELNHTVLQTEEVTVAQVTLYRNSRKLVGLGDAKKHPTDKHDPEYAYDLALARALLDLAVKVADPQVQ